MTNLEEVFLHFQKEQETEESVEDLTIKRKRKKKNINIQTLGRIYEGNYVMTGKDLLDTVKCEPSTTQSFKAIIKLRLLRLKREIGKFLWMIILPICLAAVGLYTINSLSMSSAKAPFLLNSKLYPDVPISIYNETYIKLGKLKKDDFDFMNHENFSTLLKVLPEAAAYNIAHINNEVSYTLLYSQEYVHSSPVLVNFINNAVYKNLKKNSNLIEVRSFPFGRKVIIKDSAATVVCLGIAILFPPVILATDFVYEREVSAGSVLYSVEKPNGIKVKNQLRINGLSFYVYFTSFFFLHIIIVVLIYSVLLILAWSLTTTLSSAPSLVTLGVLLAMYCPASILFFIWLSYFFDKTQTAESTMLNLSMAFGFVPILIVMLAEKSTSRLCHMIFSFTNIMYLPFGIIYTLQKIAMECRNDENCLENRLEHYVTEEVRYMYISLMVHSPVFYIMVLIAEFFKSKDRCSDIFGKDSSLEDPKEIYDIGSNEDADVKTERNRVINLLRNQGRTSSYPLVLVQNLHKEFKTSRISKSGKKSKKVALKSLSVSLDPGEVLGILGHNGAGKTTLMRTIIAEEKATRGRVQITGLKMGTYQTSLLKLIGYCPQNDAQWKTITIKEHLEMYAAIRGVPQKDIPRIIDLHLRGLQIEEYKDKRSGKCSGGTRRKLSYAIALVGSPKILLLDEPSTGMDPKSKRFLWDTVLANSQRSKGTILTTHSKEEAEALCSKVGILVKGELRCLGTPQHLKNLYGAGYTLEIKLSIGNGPGALERFKCRQFVFSEFPNALLEESFADRLLFSVPKRSILSLANCFKTLEEAKVKLNIEEYSFSQTTLDQVFLKFAYESEYED